MLKIQDISVYVNDGNKELLHGINLEINDGTTHVIMGPNGTGKSSLVKALMHHPAYKMSGGSVLYNGDDITNLSPSDIAKKGIYYISQSPVSVEGITNMEMLRTSLLDMGIKEDIFTFKKECNKICEKLNLPKSFLNRYINEGMSGGERKKNELFGMWLLKPSLVILDEIDSGLDVDALKLVGKNLREYQEETGASLLLITHQEKLIKMFKDVSVHVILGKNIKENGDILLAEDIIQNGFLKYDVTNEVDSDLEYE